MSSSCGLDIVLRVPIWIVNNNNIGTCQIDTHASGLCGKQKDVSFFVRIVVTINGSLSLFGFDLSIDSLVLVVFELQKFLNKLKHMCELREDKNLFALFFAFFEQLLNKNHFSACSHKLINLLILHFHIFQKIVFNFLDQERMVTALSELNFKIIQICIVRAWRRKSFYEHVFVFLIKCSIDCFLNVGHFHINDCLLERRNGLFDVLFHSPKHVWFEDFIQSLHLFLRGKVAEVSSEIIKAEKFLRVNVV